MRLDKYLSHMGFGTRNDVKKLIKNGWVTINDEIIKKADYNVKDEDRVCVDDEPVSYVEFEYYILNKPQGYVSATEDMMYPTVMELIQSQRHNLYPVGRLDVDTEGLLLISNDGKLTHEVLSPNSSVIVSVVTPSQSSTVSCKRPAAIVLGPQCINANVFAT